MARSRRKWARFVRGQSELQLNILDNLFNSPSYFTLRIQKWCQFMKALIDNLKAADSGVSQFHLVLLVKPRRKYMPQLFSLKILSSV